MCNLLVVTAGSLRGPGLASRFLRIMAAAKVQIRHPPKAVQNSKERSPPALPLPTG